MRWSTWCSQHTHPLHKVTIIPRGQSLGSTMSLPKTDMLNRRRKEMLDMIAVMMAGRIAEEIVSGDISSGAAGDIQQATNMARAMVMQWGMSDRLGMVQYGDDDEYVFLGREMARAKVYSEFTAQEIDGEVKRIIDEAYKIAKDIITDHRDKLELIAKSLLEYETLDGPQVEEIVRTGQVHSAAADSARRTAAWRPCGTLPEPPGNLLRPSSRFGHSRPATPGPNNSAPNAHQCRQARSAGFPACRIADFPVGSPLDSSERSQVRKPAIRQAGKPALRVRP